MTDWRFHPDAAVELDEAAAWYERRQEGVGVAFLLRVDAAIERILNDPEACPIVEGHVRRQRVWKYPYDLLYAVDDGEVVILAVAHHHRRVGYWRRRVQFPG